MKNDAFLSLHRKTEAKNKNQAETTKTNQIMKLSATTCHFAFI